MTQTTASAGNHDPVAGASTLLYQFLQRRVDSNTATEQRCCQVAGDAVRDRGSIVGWSDRILLECARVVVSVPISLSIACGTWE